MMFPATQLAALLAAQLVDGDGEAGWDIVEVGDDVGIGVDDARARRAQGAQDRTAGAVKNIDLVALARFAEWDRAGAILELAADPGAADPGEGDALRAAGQRGGDVHGSERHQVPAGVAFHHHLGVLEQRAEADGLPPPAAAVPHRCCRPTAT
jgi:hypothetical protein